MTEDMTRYCLKDLCQPLISILREEIVRSKEQGRYLWWFLQFTRPNMYCKNHLWGGGGDIIGSLTSHLGILDDEFEELFAAGENTCPDWICRPSCGWVEISSGENICLYVRYRYSEILVKRLI